MVPLFFAYPVSKVPIEAVESPSQFHNYQVIGLGGPFSGFCLSRGKVWKCCFAFCTQMANYERLKEDVLVEIELCYGHRRRWVTVLREHLEFGSNPYHLQGLIIGNATANCRHNPVFSKSWKSRREPT